MTAFDDGYEYERGRGAFRREHENLETLTRDQLAIAAIPAATAQAVHEPFQKASDLAKWLYEFADAMLEARK